MQDTEKKKKFPLTAKVCLPIWEELPKKQKCKAKPKGEQVSHCAALNFFFFFFHFDIINFRTMKYLK